MRKGSLFSLLLITLLFHFDVMAQSQNYNRSQMVRMSLENLDPEKFSFGHDYNYGEIEELWQQHYLRFNLRTNSHKSLKNWRELFPIEQDRVIPVEGRVRYYAAIPKRYQYDLILDKKEQKIKVEVRIHFYPDQGRNRVRNVSRVLVDMDEKLKAAQDLWNESAPEDVLFEFKRVKRPEDAHYSVKIVNRRQALYDRFWSLSLSSVECAHEIGHMMGLNEEYKAWSNALSLNNAEAVLNYRGVVYIRLVLNEFISMRSQNSKRFEHMSYRSQLQTIQDAIEAFEHSDAELIERANRQNLELVDFKTYYNRFVLNEVNLIRNLRCHVESIMCLRRTIYPYHYDLILSRY